MFLSNERVSFQYKSDAVLSGILLAKVAKRQPTPVRLPGQSYGRRSLVGYSPWGRAESDTTERLSSSSSSAKRG